MKDFKSLGEFATVYPDAEVLCVKYISHKAYSSIKHFDYVIATKVDYVSTWEADWRNKMDENYTKGLIGRGHGGPGMPDAYSIYKPHAWIIEDKNK